MNQGNPPTPLPREPSGNAKEVGWFKAVLKNLRERTVRVGPGLRASYRSDGTVIELVREKVTTETAEPGVVQRFYLDVVENEWLNCRKADEDGTPIGVAGQDFYRIAKPPGLRLPSSLEMVDGDFTIVYTGSNTREVQWNQDRDLKIIERLKPPYGPPANVSPDLGLMDTEIYATKPVGKTGLTITVAVPGQETPQPVQLEWIECVAVRQWVPDYTTVKSCLPGDSPLANWQRVVKAGARVNIA